MTTVRNVVISFVDEDGKKFRVDIDPEVLVSFHYESKTDMTPVLDSMLVRFVPVAVRHEFDLSFTTGSSLIAWTLTEVLS